MKLNGNTILITGGGSGIGRTLAHRFHDAGNTVVIAGRQLPPLHETAEGRAGIYVLQYDADDAASTAAFVDELLGKFPDMNVLFNNAGIMRMEGSLAARRDLTDAEAQIVSNLVGPIRLTNLLVEHLSSRPGAAIVNVTSGLAFVPLVIAPTYSATKAAIHSYTISLRAVLKGKVEVIELAPPAVRTDLTPGQAANERFMPLEDFADQVMAKFGIQPTPTEILVDGVDFMRNAEIEGRFSETLAALNPFLG